MEDEMRQRDKERERDKGRREMEITENKQCMKKGYVVQERGTHKT